jgi:putative FmdB family regulatory protein
MPTYEYACTNAECGNRFDLVQSFSDPAATECPVCGQPVRKVYGAVGVVFKGSGFYRNDSRDSKRSVDAGSSNGSSSGTESAASSSSSSSESNSGKSESSSGKSESTKTESAPKADKPAATSKPAPASTSA